jgi:hypothetical protein
VPLQQVFSVTGPQLPLFSCISCWKHASTHSSKRYTRAHSSLQLSQRGCLKRSNLTQPQLLLPKSKWAPKIWCPLLHQISGRGSSSACRIRQLELNTDLFQIYGLSQGHGQINISHFFPMWGALVGTACPIAFHINLLDFIRLQQACHKVCPLPLSLHLLVHCLSVGMRVFMTPLQPDTKPHMLAQPSAVLSWHNTGYPGASKGSRSTPGQRP